ncbi:hypothetical protein PPTG_20667 [Phytophthora nicotianae INRA-310]|uniref:Uncharacterized protein n=1 Tax=Phytophthora nicotianae (strain INRA-310) TaxID=761204 RepID=W2RDU7_PHYN3|nr:hypothetical protein PPTG_20667 [Phytophthora nicotianae INRA-310]ETN23567.1 hypothetical protein PPTG_20667 [Phytophthora nicotianae INRA-310]
MSDLVKEVRASLGSNKPHRTAQSDDETSGNHAGLARAPRSSWHDVTCSVNKWKKRIVSIVFVLKQLEFVCPGPSDRQSIWGYRGWNQMPRSSAAVERKNGKQETDQAVVYYVRCS